MIDLEKLSRPWKKVLISMPLDSFDASILHIPEGVEIVGVCLKLYGEGLPEKYRTPQGELIQWITPEQLAELAVESST